LSLFNGKRVSAAASVSPRRHGDKTPTGTAAIIRRLEFVAMIGRIKSGDDHESGAHGRILRRHEETSVKPFRCRHCRA